MATITNQMVPAKLVRVVDVGTYNLDLGFSNVAGGDVVNLFQSPCGLRVVDEPRVTGGTLSVAAGDIIEPGEIVTVTASAANGVVDIPLQRL